MEAVVVATPSNQTRFGVLAVGGLPDLYSAIQVKSVPASGSMRISSFAIE